MEQTTLKKETSIKWLMTQLYKKGFIKEVDGNEPINLMNQAKAMEKEQIIEAHGMKTERDIKCGVDFWHVKHGEAYYNETYKGGEQ